VTGKRTNKREGEREDSFKHLGADSGKKMTFNEHTDIYVSQFCIDVIFSFCSIYIS